MSAPSKSASVRPAPPAPTVRRALPDQRVEPTTTNRGVVRPALPARATARATKNRGPMRRAIPRS
jgi:hypothetical protein